MSDAFAILLGYMMILWSQWRRLLGYSYYRLDENPLAVGRGEPVTLRIDYPPADGRGWRVVGEVVVHSGRLMIFDPIESDGPVLAVPAGRYLCELQRWRLPAHGTRNIRARVLWADVEGEVIGEPVEPIGVDLGMLIIADATFTDSAWYREVQQHSSFFHAVRPDDRPYWQLPSGDGSGAHGAFAFATGVGDGLYELYELRAGARAVGLLVEMTTGDICIAAVRRQGWRQRRRVRRELPAMIARFQAEIAEQGKEKPD